MKRLIILISILIMVFGLTSFSCSNDKVESKLYTVIFNGERIEHLHLVFTSYCSATFRDENGKEIRVQGTALIIEE